MRGVALTLLVPLVAGGCSPGGYGNPSPTPTLNSGTQAVAQAETLTGKPPGATLTMARGHSRAKFKVIALDPPTHVFGVRIVAPESADVRVRMRTANGRLLYMLDSTRSKEWVQGAHHRSICQLPFPALEAQLGGR